MKNHRRALMFGLRERISRERFGWKLLFLWSALMDAGELQ